MKVIVGTKQEIPKSVLPRDVRNYVGSIVDDRYKDFFMWHEHKQPPVIYAKPFRKGFEIIFYFNDFDAITHLMEKIKENRNFYGVEISKVWSKEESLIPPIKTTEPITYTTRSPLIVGTNPVEWGITNNIKNDKEKLKEYLIYKIKDTISHQLKEYIGIEVDLKDVQITVQECKFFFQKYKESSYPAFTATFESNYQLPRFVGYKIGLGYGEIYKKREVSISKMNSKKPFFNDEKMF